MKFILHKLRTKYKLVVTNFSLEG